VREGFAKAGLVTDHGPIVGVNANAANPTTSPPRGTAPIRAGDWVLLTCGPSFDQPARFYYDITLDRLLRR